MNREVEIIISPAACGKTELVLDRYRDAVRARGEGSGVLLLLPTALAVDQAKARLMARGKIDAVFAPNICSFYDFVNPIILHNSQISSEVSEAQQHAILHRIVESLKRAGTLPTLMPSTGFGGFVDSLIRLFEVLKEATVRPDQLIEAYPEPGTREHELAIIYSRYQDYLTKNNLYDSQGKLWRAGRLIEKGHREPFQDVDEMLIDGFADFTTAEFDIIRAMGQHCARITFTLTCETDSRADLFGNTRATLELIRRFFKNAKIRKLDSPESVSGRALDESRLFSRADLPRRPTPGSVAIVGMPSRADEIAEVGRRIKRMIVEDGRSPADIAVLYRAQGGYDTLINEIFTEQGLPFYIDATRPILRLPELRALMRMVNLPAEDFSCRAVCRFIKALRAAPVFEGIDDPATALDYCARRAGILRGRDTWLPRLTAWRDRLAADVAVAPPERSAGLAEKIAIAERGLKIAQIFFEETENLQVSKTPALHAAEIHRLAETFGLDAGPLYDTVRGELKKIAALPDVSNIVMTYEVFAEHFRAVKNYRQKWSGGDRACSIIVTDVLKARNVVFPVVFLVGMAEREFPRPILQNAFINDAERREMKRTGGPSLPESGDEQGKEMPLFYNAITRAAEMLVLTYPALDASGNEVRRSWYLDEIERAFDNIVSDVGLVAASAPPLSRATTLREAAAAFVQEAKSGAAPAPPRALNTAELAAQIVVDSARDSFDDFGRFDGVLTDSSAKKILAESLDRTVFSTSRMNSFLACPFTYFCSRVLRLDKMPRPSAGVTPLELGTWYHTNLQRFYSERVQPAAVTKDNLEAAQSRMAEICEEHFRSLCETGVVRHDRIFAIEHRQMAAKLAAVLEYEAGKNESEITQPTYSEFGFGFAKPKPDADPKSVVQTFDLDCNGRTARFRGYVDRIDFGPNNEVVIKDYKSGGAPLMGAVAEGTDIQLPLYVMAVRDLLLEGKAMDYRAHYVILKESRTTTTVKDGNKRYNLAEILDAAHDSIANALEAIADGRFPPQPSKACPHDCPCVTACKYSKRRIEKKSE